MINPKLLWFLAIILLFQVITCFAQTDSIESSVKNDAPKLFILCSYCDLDYIRQEISFMNFVRHPDEADIKILITSTSTASGGDEYKIVFEGAKSYINLQDTLIYISKINDSEETIRKNQVHRIKLGLIPFLSKKPIADNLIINFKKSEGIDKPPEDPWDYWIFSLSTSGYFSGEKSSNSTSLFGQVSASRVTEDLKFELSYSNRYNEDNFNYGSTSVRSFSKSNSAYSELIPSITEHFSAGLFANASQSSYYNTKFSGKIWTGLEYNFYPYSLSTTKQLSFRYTIGYQYYKYFEETIYNKTSENLGTHKFSVTYLIKDTWGSINSSISYSNYLNDFSKKNLYLSTSFSFYLLGGLSANMYGSFSMIHDQIYLPKGGADPEEVLLRRKALSTNYSYYCYFGLTYSFGSIYNNVVNPRF
jgi:hypothetical protein